MIALKVRMWFWTVHLKASGELLQWLSDISRPAPTSKTRSHTTFYPSVSVCGTVISCVCTAQQRIQAIVSSFCVSAKTLDFVESVNITERILNSSPKGLKWCKMWHHQLNVIRSLLFHHLCVCLCVCVHLSGTETLHQGLQSPPNIPLLLHHPTCLALFAQQVRSRLIWTAEIKCNYTLLHSNRHSVRSRYTISSLFPNFL